MKTLLVGLAFLMISTAGAATSSSTSLEELVESADEIALAKIESFVGYTASGSLVTAGEFRTGPDLHNSIHAKLRLTAILAGAGSEAGSLIELPLESMEIKDLASMQEMFTGKEVIVFLRVTPTGAFSIDHDLVFKGSNLPTIKKMISRKSTLQDRAKRARQTMEFEASEKR